MPIDAQVSPLPSELTTPPVTKICLAIVSSPRLCSSVRQPKTVVYHGRLSGRFRQLEVSPCRVIEWMRSSRLRMFDSATDGPPHAFMESCSMPPIRVNRRRFLGCSAAASLALSQGNLAEAAGRGGRRGPGAAGSDRHRQSGDGAAAEPARAAGCVDRRGLRRRAQAPAARAGDRREGAAAIGRRRTTTRGGCWIGRTSTRSSIALPCDLHEPVYRDAIAAGKHLYAEKPLAPSLAACDRLIALAAQAPRAGGPRRLPAAVEPAVSRGGRADPPRASWVAWSRRGPPGAAATAR